jgi:type II secretory pathway component PulF
VTVRRLLAQILPRASQQGVRADLVCELRRAWETSGKPVEALRDAAAEHPSWLVRGCLDRLAGSLARGALLSDALGELGRVAGPEVVAVARAGEESGRMSGALRALDAVVARTAQGASEVRAVRLGPTIAVVAAVIVFVLLGGGPLPLLYSFTERPLPLLLRPAQFAYENPMQAVLLALLLAVVAWSVHRVLASSERGERWLSTVPLWGALQRTTRAALFTRTLALLAGAGVPLERAVEVGIGVFPHGRARRELEDARRRMATGEPAKKVFREGRGLTTLLRVALAGPASEDAMAEGLGRIAEFYEAEVDRMGEQVRVTAEVAAICLAGVLTGAVVIGMWGGYFTSVSAMAF